MKKQNEKENILNPKNMHEILQLITPGPSKFNKNHIDQDRIIYSDLLTFAVKYLQ